MAGEKELFQVVKAALHGFLEMASGSEAELTLDQLRSYQKCHEAWRERICSSQTRNCQSEVYTWRCSTGQKRENGPKEGKNSLYSEVIFRIHKICIIDFIAYLYT